MSVDRLLVVLGTAGAVPTVDEAAGEHQPSRRRWDGGDQDEGLHSALKGEENSSRNRAYRDVCYEHV